MKVDVIGPFSCILVTFRGGDYIRKRLVLVCVFVYRKRITYPSLNAYSIYDYVIRIKYICNYETLLKLGGYMQLRDTVCKKGGQRSQVLSFLSAFYTLQLGCIFMLVTSSANVQVVMGRVDASE